MEADPMRRQSEFRYSKLAAILREQIVSGLVKPGEFLMSENQLCNYYQMSRTSVRKCLDELLKEGLIVKRAGQGTIVNPDLVLTEDKRKVLRIIATSPSHFVDTCMEIFIEDFKQKYSNVDVKILNFPHLDFWESIRASSEMGLQPDLVFVTDRQFHDADQIDEFLDLRELLDDEIHSIYPRMISAFSQDDKLRAIPVTLSTVYLAYNPEMFDQYRIAHPTQHWCTSDFIDASQKLTMDTDQDGIIDQYGFALTTSISRWPVIALQNKVKFNSGLELDQIHKTLSFMHELIHRHRVVTLYQPNRYRINSDAFMVGKAGMTLTTSIEVAGWRNQHMKFEPKVAPLPFGDHKSTLLVSNAFMAPTHANDPELAALFLKHIYQPEVQLRVCTQSHFLSALHDVNAQLWEPAYLESLNIIGGRIENSFFLHEVFPDLHLADDLENEMELYWAGLENAKDFSQKIIDMVASNG